MELYELVRRSVLVDGMSKRAAAREYGIHRRTVHKMVKNPVPEGYRLSRERARPKLADFLERIEEILREDAKAPTKQRHTAKRIYERLRDEHGYTGGVCQVRRAVARIKGSRPREAFVPLVSIPGEAECDFGESWVEIAGVRRKAYGFYLTLPFSGVCVLQMYPAENAESFVDGHLRAFAFFGGVPRRIVYDNPAYAVNRRGKLTGRERDLATDFGELRSRCLFEAVFANVASGNEKGSVERKVATLRQNWLVPVPKAESFEELNRILLEKAAAHRETRAEAFAEDAARFLPEAPYEASRLVTGQADKLSLVRFETCAYSVPTRLVLKSLLIQATPFEIRILCGKELVAQHSRSYEKNRAFAQISHYIDLLERKPRAARSALPVIQAGLPDVFEAYRRKVEDAKMEGDLKFVGVLRLATEFGVPRVAEALELAVAQKIVEPPDIRLLLLKQAEPLFPSLASQWNNPAIQSRPIVIRPPLCEYDSLLTGAAS